MTTATLLILLLMAAVITLGVMAVSWWQDERAHRRAERQVDEFLRERGE